MLRFNLLLLLLSINLLSLAAEPKIGLSGTKAPVVRSYLISAHAITYCEASAAAWEEQIEPNFRSCSARQNDYCFARNLGGQGTLKRLATPTDDPEVFGSCMYVTVNSLASDKHQMVKNLQRLRPDWSEAEWVQAAKILGVSVERLLTPPSSPR